MAVTKARTLGVKGLMIPSAGNAGGAAAVYGARAGVPVAVVVPRGTPEAAVAEALLAGAHVFTVEGSIATAGRAIAQIAPRLGWFDLATLKEPYRLEGKKTMGLELAEQLEWETPDVLMYPTGGGTGLVGIWKGYDGARGDGLGPLPSAALHRRAGGGLRAGGARLAGEGARPPPCGRTRSRMPQAFASPAPSPGARCYASSGRLRAGRWR